MTAPAGTPASTAEPPLHVGLDGAVFRQQPGDNHVLRGQCPNRHGPMQKTAGGQRCPDCGFNTNIPTAERG